MELPSGLCWGCPSLLLRVAPGEAAAGTGGRGELATFCGEREERASASGTVGDRVGLGSGGRDRGLRADRCERGYETSPSSRRAGADARSQAGLLEQKPLFTIKGTS